jgi:hypothetical protein
MENDFRPWLESTDFQEQSHISNRMRAEFEKTKPLSLLGKSNKKHLKKRTHQPFAGTRGQAGTTAQSGRAARN